MNSNSIFAILWCLVVTMTVGPNSERPEAIDATSRYLPSAHQLVGWQPEGSSLRFVDEDLYSLIDGGAVIYYEYGFRQVITQEYVSAKGSSVNLEIFEMADPASAYGIYTFKADRQGTLVSVGAEALLGVYYLNFWKGRFCVTLGGSDTGKETREGMLLIGRAVAERIEEKAERPPLVSLLPQDSLTTPGVSYLKGKLGLTAHYDFHPENIFGVQEGVVGDYRDFQLLILRYDNEDEALKWFRSAGNDLRNAQGYSGFTENRDGFFATDAGGRCIHVRPHESYILIFVGPREIDSDTQLEKLEGRIERASVGVYPEGGIDEQKDNKNP